MNVIVVAMGRARVPLWSVKMDERTAHLNKINRVQSKNGLKCAQRVNGERERDWTNCADFMAIEMYHSVNGMKIELYAKIAMICP